MDRSAQPDDTYQIHHIIPTSTPKLVAEHPQPAKPRAAVLGPKAVAVKCKMCSQQVFPFPDARLPTYLGTFLSFLLSCLHQSINQSVPATATCSKQRPEPLPSTSVSLSLSLSLMNTIRRKAR
jgi:hypothetical protein